MTNLTDKWKKGELPDGFYWCDVDIYEDGNITKQIESFIHHHPVFYWETSIVRVIELAPSFSEYKSMQDENTKLKKWYEEWQASDNYIDYLKQCISVYESKEKQHVDDAVAYNELAEENTKLKELLKRVNEHFKWVDFDDNNYVNYELWGDIKKVLGKE